MLRNIQTGRSHYYQLSNAPSMLRGECGRDASAHGQPDQIDLLQSELIDHFEIVHGVVMHRGVVRSVAGIAPTGMVRNQHAVVGGPWQGEVEAVPGSSAMKEEQRLSAPGSQQGHFRAVDGECFLFEIH